MFNRTIKPARPEIPVPARARRREFCVGNFRIILLLCLYNEAYYFLLLAFLPRKHAQCTTAVACQSTYYTRRCRRLHSIRYSVDKLMLARSIVEEKATMADIVIMIILLSTLCSIVRRTGVPF